MAIALYSLSLPEFEAAVEQHLSRALRVIPSVDHSSADDEETIGDTAQKSLPELLANLGNPVSCPFCSVPLAKGTTARLCLACGKALGPLPAGTADIWRSSRAQQMFVASLGLSSDTLAHAAPVPPGANGHTDNSTPLISDDFAAPELLFDDGIKPFSPSQPLSAPQLSMFEQSSGPMAPPSASESNAMGDFFSQLVGLEAAVDSKPESGSSPSASQETKALPDRQAEVLHQILHDLPDLSFMLSEYLVVKDQKLRAVTTALEPAPTASTAMETSASFFSSSTLSTSSFLPTTEEPSSASATFSSDASTPTHVPLQEMNPSPSSSPAPFEAVQVGSIETLLEKKSDARLDNLNQVDINASNGLSMRSATNVAEISEEEDNEWGDFSS